MEKKYTKPKRGDTREDGLIFWNRKSDCVDGEHWVTPQQFLKNKADQKKNMAAYVANRKIEYAQLHKVLVHGDTRITDNKVFWSYGLTYKNFEQWISPEQFKKRTTLQLNRAKTKQYRTKQKERQARNYKNDLMFKLRSNIRSLIGHSFKRKDITKDSPTSLILGCSFGELKKHMESQFVGIMSWDNQGRGGWTIDHRLPLSAGNTKEEIIALNHYTNLQPMWDRENNSKNNNYCPKELAVYLESRLPLTHSL